MLGRNCLGLVATLGAAVALGCGADEPAEVGDLRQLLEVMAGGTQGALAAARPIVSQDPSAVAETWAGEVKRHAAAEAEVHSMLLQGRELLARADLDAAVRHPEGRALYGRFLDDYERLADAYAKLREPYVYTLESLETGDGVAAGIGRTQESFAANLKERLAGLAVRADEAYARYLEDRARHARLLRIAGDTAGSRTSAARGQAFLERHRLAGLERFDAVGAEFTKLAALGD